MEAGVQCLTESGYTGTTTDTIARRAGLTPGALKHHYPTRADLLGGVIAHLFTTFAQQVQHTLGRVKPGPERLSASIDALWTVYSSPTYAAIFELTASARTDPELHTALSRTVPITDGVVIQLAGDLLGEELRKNPRVLDLGLMIINAMQGMAMRRLTRDTRAEVQSQLALFKSLIREAIAPPAPRGRRARSPS
jgi:AcrR family transcriptional regulator